MRPTNRGLRLTALGRGVVVRVIVTVDAPEVGPTARRPPSQKVRVAAARVRVSSDRQVHRRTPEWITALANSDITDADARLPHGEKRPTGGLSQWRRQ
ncbi:hypothetical protein GCM10027057_25860 [Marisediminicola antarctica]